MTNLTRRSVIKTGIAASAGRIGPSVVLFDPSAAAEGRRGAGGQAAQGACGFGRAAFTAAETAARFWVELSPGQCRLGSRRFQLRIDGGRGTFAKSGQIVGHNEVKNGKVTQLTRDDSGWQTINVPHYWALGLPFVSVEEPFVSAHAAHGGKPLGRNCPKTSIGWYRRRFDVPAEDKGMRISFEFDGVFRDCFVVSNDFLLGRNFSGYSPFSFDVTDFVEYGGTNLIEVRVDATLNEGWYYEGAGIYRHTWLTKTQPLHVAQWGTTVRSEIRGAGAEVTIETELRNEGDTSAHGHLVCTIFGPAGETAAKVRGKPFEIAPWGSLILEHAVLLTQVKLWSLKTPNLYRVVTQIESDGAIADHDATTFGIHRFALTRTRASS